MEQWVKIARARFAELKESEGLTQAILGERVGVSQGTIGHWFSGRRSPENIAQYRKLATSLYLSLSELLGESNVSPAPALFTQVPLVSWVAAGVWCQAEDAYPPGEGEEMVDTTAKVGSRAYALRVRGDSMIDPSTGRGFPEGAILIVDPDCRAENGNYVIVRLDESDEAVFKQLIIDGPTTYLKPLNPRYPILQLDQEATLCGVVRRMELEVNF